MKGQNLTGQVLDICLQHKDTQKKQASKKKNKKKPQEQYLFMASDTVESEWD